MESEPVADNTAWNLQRNSCEQAALCASDAYVQQSYTLEDLLSVQGCISVVE